MFAICAILRGQSAERLSFHVGRRALFSLWLPSTRKLIEYRRLGGDDGDDSQDRAPLMTHPYATSARAAGMLVSQRRGTGAASDRRPAGGRGGKTFFDLVCRPRLKRFLCCAVQMKMRMRALSAGGAGL